MVKHTLPLCEDVGREEDVDIGDVGKGRFTRRR